MQRLNGSPMTKTTVMAHESRKITDHPSAERAEYQYELGMMWLKQDNNNNVEMAHQCFENARQMVSVISNFPLAVKIYKSMVLSWLCIGVLPPRVWFKARPMKDKLEPYAKLVDAYIFGDKLDTPEMREQAEKDGLLELYELVIKESELRVFAVLNNLSYGVVDQVHV